MHGQSKSTATSPKPLTDKPLRQTDKPGACSRPFPTGQIVLVGQYLSSGSRIGIHIILYKPLSLGICHSYHTLKVTATHQEQLLDHLMVLWFFIELNLFLYVMISRHRRQQNPAPAQPASPPPPPSRRRNHRIHGSCHERGERMPQNTCGRANQY